MPRQAYPQPVAPGRCPRCRGRLSTERDRYGVYDSCFLCGYSRDRHAGPAPAPAETADDRAP